MGIRDIIFRGKRVDTGEWVEGLPYYRYDSFFGKYRLHIQLQRIKPKVDFVIDPETVGQYTGLNDKNGNKIFEGDIIKAKLMGIYCVPEIAEVDFQRGAFGLKWYVGDTKKFTRLDTDYLPTLEIIGSVHDNPELLEVK